MQKKAEADLPAYLAMIAAGVQMLKNFGEVSVVAQFLQMLYTLLDQADNGVMKMRTKMLHVFCK